MTILFFGIIQTISVTIKGRVEEGLGESGGWGPKGVLGLFLYEFCLYYEGVGSLHEVLHYQFSSLI